MILVMVLRLNIPNRIESYSRVTYKNGFKVEILISSRDNSVHNVFLEIAAIWNTNRFSRSVKTKLIFPIPRKEVTVRVNREIISFYKSYVDSTSSKNESSLDTCIDETVEISFDLAPEEEILNTWIPNIRKLCVKCKEWGPRDKEMCPECGTKYMWAMARSKEIGK